MNPNIIGIIKHFWPVLHTSKTLTRLFQEEPMCAFRRSTNLKDTLVTARISYPHTPKEKKLLPNPRHTTCPNITCRYCRILTKCNKVSSSYLLTEFDKRIWCRTSCLTTNVVYLITCLKCNIQYVGETKRPLQKRMYEHIRSIDKFGNPSVQATPVGEHFNCSCQRPARYNFQILETIRGNTDLEQVNTYRKKRELWWILTLRTLDPIGLNIHM